MSTQPIEQTVQGYTYKRPKRTQGEADFSLGPEQSKKRQETDADTQGSVRDHIRALLSKVADVGDDRVSFKAVSDYHDALQSGWNRDVSDDLADLGVNVSAPFRLSYDPAGGVTVAGDHPHREMINAYFSTNPARVNELGEILQFGKLAGVAESRLSPQDMEQTLQTEAMAWWYASNMNTTSLFTGGGMMFGAGGVAYKGLDIHV
nr:hypothetical protein [Pseudodesulfovibrio sp.]